jgi:hypothetical protein
VSVGPTRGPVERPGLDRDLTELLQRVADIERITPGLQFGITNDGTFLLVTTNSAIPGVGYGIAFNDNGSNGTFVGAGGTGDVMLMSTGGSAVLGFGGGISTPPLNAARVTLDGMDVELRTGGISPGARRFVVRHDDAIGGPLELFRVDSDGSIHGLASVGSITWDLA